MRACRTFDIARARAAPDARLCLLPRHVYIRAVTRTLLARQRRCALRFDDERRVVYAISAMLCSDVMPPDAAICARCRCRHTHALRFYPRARLICRPAGDALVPRRFAPVMLYYARHGVERYECEFCCSMLLLMLIDLLLMLSAISRHVDYLRAMSPLFVATRAAAAVYVALRAMLLRCRCCAFASACLCYVAVRCHADDA